MTASDTASLSIMVGIPGCGKSTYIAQLSGTEFEAYSIMSSDRIREELTGDSTNQEQNDGVFDLLHERVRSHLKGGWPVVVDATNLTEEYRSKLMGIARELDIRWTNAYLFLSSLNFDLCQARNLTRHDRFEPVPDKIMQRFHELFMEHCKPDQLEKEGWTVTLVKETT